MTSDINELIRDAYANALAHGWHDTERSFPEILMLLVSEIAEAMEEFRNHRGVNEIYFIGDKPEGIPIEVADLLIRVFDWAGAENVDLLAALDIKMRYNRGRTYRHGDKKL